VRKFYLENSVGSRVSLCDPKGIWLNYPAGLGMAYGRIYESTLDGFWQAVNDQEEQTSISGTLILRAKDPYKLYTDFTNWVMQSEGLKFVYKPTGGTEYFKDINIEYIGKTEKRMNKLMECSVSFIPLTPWYSKYKLSFDFASEPTENYKRYNNRYPLRYAASHMPNSKDFEIDGHYPAEIEMRANGALIAPVLIITNTNTGEVYGKLDLSTISIGVGETLLYSSRLSNPGVWKLVDGEYTSLIDDMELSAETESFFRVPPHTPLTATMAVTGTIENRAVIDIYKYYRLR
jgi:hypothetical protein